MKISNLLLIKIIQATKKACLRNSENMPYSFLNTKETLPDLFSHKNISFSTDILNTPQRSNSLIWLL